MLLSTLLFLENPGTLAFIAILLLLVFGAKRIPEMFRGLGQGMKEFKDATRPDAPAAPNYQAPQPGYGPPASYAQGPPAAPGAYDPNAYPQQYPAQPAAYPAAPLAPGQMPTQVPAQVPPAPYNPAS